MTNKGGGAREGGGEPRTTVRRAQHQLEREQVGGEFCDEGKWVNTGRNTKKQKGREVLAEA